MKLQYIQDLRPYLFFIKNLLFRPAFAVDKVDKEDKAFAGSGLTATRSETGLK